MAEAVDRYRDQKLSWVPATGTGGLQGGDRQALLPPRLDSGGDLTSWFCRVYG